MPVKLGRVTLPEGFLNMRSFGIGLGAMAIAPFRRVRPYLGWGVSMLVNRVTSPVSGPANLVTENEGVRLDTTSLGVGFEVPVGVRVELPKNKFLFIEFRPVWNWFSYVSGDLFQKELDTYRLDMVQVTAGFGFGLPDL